MTDTVPTPEKIGYCGGCGYDLRGLAKTRCPECGAEFNAESVQCGDPKWCKARVRGLRRVQFLQGYVLLALVSSANGFGHGYFTIAVRIYSFLAALMLVLCAINSLMRLFIALWPVDEVSSASRRNIKGVLRTLVLILTVAVVPGLLFAALMFILTGGFAAKGELLGWRLAWVALGGSMFLIESKRIAKGRDDKKIDGIPFPIVRSLRTAVAWNRCLVAACATGLVLLTMFGL